MVRLSWPGWLVQYQGSIPANGGHSSFAIIFFHKGRLLVLYFSLVAPAIIVPHVLHLLYSVAVKGFRAPFWRLSPLFPFPYK